VDLIYQKSIPIEYGAEELNAVSYNKGCYIGQEIVSRTKYLGQVRKKIFKLTAVSHLVGVENGDIIEINDIKIGTILSSYKNLAICLLKEEQFFLLPQKQIIVKGLLADITIPEWRS
jgi:folate-binding protein YgfZ